MNVRVVDANPKACMATAGDVRPGMGFRCGAMYYLMAHHDEGDERIVLVADPGREGSATVALDLTGPCARQGNVWNCSCPVDEISDLVGVTVRRRKP